MTIISSSATRSIGSISPSSSMISVRRSSPYSLADALELVADDRHEQRGVGEDRLEVGDEDAELLELGLDLVALEAGEPLQAHVEDRLGLARGQVVRLAAGGLDLGRGAFAALEEAGEAEQRLGAQGGAGLLGVLGGADDRDDAVDRVDRHADALDDLAALERLLQFVAGAAGDDRAAVVEEVLEAVAQAQHGGAAVGDGDHVDAEADLQVAHFKERVEDDLGGGVALDLDPDAHAGAVAVVLDVADALDLLLADELGDVRDELGLVDLVGDLGDDDRLAALLLLDLAAGADGQAAAAGHVGLADAGVADDEACGREVGAADVLQELADAEVGVVDEGEAGGDQLAEVVRRDVGRHADGDADGAVEQEVRDPGREDRGLELLLVVVGDPVDGVLLEVGQQLAGHLRHADFGVAHGGGHIAVDAAEVALAVDQRGSAWRSPGRAGPTRRRPLRRRAGGTCR
jgi:hypothetical protein